MRTKVTRTDDEWLEILGPERYDVMRRKATERPWSGEYCEIKEPGLYRRAACATALFRSETKFESGTGWPSFFGPADENLVRLEDDHSFGMRRTEVLCATCDSIWATSSRTARPRPACATASIRWRSSWNARRAARRRLASAPLKPPRQVM